MRRAFCEKPEHLSIHVERLLSGHGKISRAYEATETVKECIFPPGSGEYSCRESKIPVDVEGDLIWVACPVLSTECSRGVELRIELKNYSLANVRSIPGVPSRFHASLAQPQNTDAVVGSKSWAREPVTFLVLHGNHGTGKSFAAAYSLFHLAFRKNSAHWQIPSQWSPLNAMWVSAYRATTKEELFEEARVKPVLVLDDLGSELTSPASRYKIAEIIAERSNHKRLTILTMNADPQNGERGLKAYGERTIDRVIGESRIIYCGGESLRLSA